MRIKLKSMQFHVLSYLPISLHCLTQGNKTNNNIKVSWHRQIVWANMFSYQISSTHFLWLLQSRLKVIRCWNSVIFKGTFGFPFGYFMVHLHFLPMAMTAVCTCKNCMAFCSFFLRCSAKRTLSALANVVDDVQFRHFEVLFKQEYA